MEILERIQSRKDVKAISVRLFLFSADFGVSVNNVPHSRVRGRLFV